MIDKLNIGIQIKNVCNSAGTVRLKENYKSLECIVVLHPFCPTV